MTKKEAVTRIGLALWLVALVGCSDVKVEEAEPYVTEQSDKIRERSGTFHGNPKGIVLYSTRDRGDEQNGAAAGGWFGGGAQGQTPGSVGVAVNPYLWQATLESLDFMPLAQADSNGGVVITDWYAPPETPDERFKVNVYIVDRTLRADAVRVGVFRQVNGDHGWVDAAVDEGTARGLEDNILKRARELRLASTGEAAES